MTAHVTSSADESRWRNLPIEGVVGVALDELLDARREVESVVAHVADVRDVDSLLFAADHLLQGTTGSVVECNVTTVLGHAFVMLVQRRPRRVTDDLTPPIVSISPVSSERWRLSESVHAARVVASPQSRSVYGGFTQDEFLLEVLPKVGNIWPDGPYDLGPAASIAARMAREARRPLWFVNGPASPPSKEIRAPAGPFLRFGVSGLEGVESRFEFGQNLVTECARAGIGVQLPAEYGGLEDSDFWREILAARAVHPIAPATSDRGADHTVTAPRQESSSATAPSPATAAGSHRAVTLVGPARPGMTARLVNWINGTVDRPNSPTPTRPVHGLFMSSFADLAIVNALTTTPELTKTPNEGIDDLPAHEVLTSLYGASPDVSESAPVLTDDRLLVTDMAPNPEVFDTHRQTLWLTWKVPHPRPLSFLLPAARWAFGSVLGPGHDLVVDYLVMRAADHRQVAGRAKVSIAPRTLSPRESGALVREVDLIEQRWRERVEVTVELSRFDLRVAWRESWVQTSTDLHGAAPNRR